MGIFREVKYLPECEKELRRLSKKRFRTLREDLDTFIDTSLKLYHKQNKTDFDGIVPISNLDIPYPEIFKATKFACRSLKGRGAKSGIRIIYAYHREKDIIEFIEIYFKGDKENEDRERIKKYYR